MKTLNAGGGPGPGLERQAGARAARVDRPEPAAWTDLVDWPDLVDCQDRAIWADLVVWPDLADWTEQTPESPGGQRPGEQHTGERGARK